MSAPEIPEALRLPAGSVRRITSFSNPLIKEVRGLALKKHRARAGLFVAEGAKFVRDALDAGWPPTLVLTAGLERPFVAETVAAARTAGAAIVETSREVLEKVARRDNPQTVIAVFPQRRTRLEAVARGLWVVLEEARDPGNIGTIVRTIDAVGAAGLVLVGDCADAFGIEAVRATMGSVFHVPIVESERDAFLAWRASYDGPVVGAHLAGTADYRTARYREPALLVMGAEQSGLSDALAKACDLLVKIPMAGRADSLNLAIATALMLYEIRRDHLSPAG